MPSRGGQDARELVGTRPASVLRAHPAGSWAAERDKPPSTLSELGLVYGGVRLGEKRAKHVASKV